MPEATQTEPIVREQWVNARPETVFAFFVEPEKATRWLAAEVVADPRPGGTLVRLTHRDLPVSVRADHEAGWKELLGRLAVAV